MPLHVSGIDESLQRSDRKAMRSKTQIRSGSRSTTAIGTITSRLGIDKEVCLPPRLHLLWKVQRMPLWSEVDGRQVPEIDLLLAGEFDSSVWPRSSALPT